MLTCTHACTVLICRFLTMTKMVLGFGHQRATTQWELETCIPLSLRQSTRPFQRYWVHANNINYYAACENIEAQAPVIYMLFVYVDSLHIKQSPHLTSKVASFPIHLCSNVRIITSTKYSWVSRYHAQPYLLVLPHNNKGVVYCIPCQDCDKVYSGKMGRTLNVRIQKRTHLTNGHSRGLSGSCPCPPTTWWLCQEESKGGTTNKPNR